VTGNVSVTDRDAIWAEIVAQVHRQSCGLGHYAAPPPLLEPHAAESAARNAPMPLAGEEPLAGKRESMTAEPLDLVNGFVPAGTTVDGPLELERVLAHWAETSTELAVGDVRAFGGSPVITVRMNTDEFVLNRDTKRAAVLAFLAAASDAGGADNLPWHVTTNSRGTINRVSYRPDDAATPGWYAYLRDPAPERRELL
jgi:hypothetical protein